MLGFPTLIAVHSIGMGVAVGLSLMITLHLHRIFRGLKPDLIPRLLGVAVWGFGVNLVTGVALFVSRGTEYIASEVFVTKMLLVLTSAMILFWLRHRLKVVEPATKPLAPDLATRSMSLICSACWFGAVATGRLIAYMSELY